MIRRALREESELACDAAVIQSSAFGVHSMQPNFWPLQEQSMETRLVEFRNQHGLVQ